MINVCLFREKKYKRSKTKLLEVVFRRKNYFLLFTKRNNASVIIKRILKCLLLERKCGSERDGSECEQRQATEQNIYFDCKNVGSLFFFYFF